MKTITSQQAKTIIHIACNTWKRILAKEWGEAIIMNDKINITNDRYQEMRKACTAEQHILFDSIFGKDEPEYKVGDWVIRTKEHGGIHKIGRIIQIKKLLCGNSFLAVQDKQNTSHMLSSVRLATPEEIKKSQYYPDGTPCLTKGSGLQAWRLRYADGNGRFYCDGKKSGITMNLDHHMKLDMNNLPVND